MGRTLIGGSAVASPTVNTTTTTSSQSWQEQQTEGYPIFGMWGSDGGNQYQSMQMFDSVFNTRGTPHGAKANSTTSYQFGNFTDGAMGYNGDHSNVYQTTGQLTTQDAGGGTYWVQGNRNNNMFPMHEVIDLSPTGSWRSLYGTNNTTSSSPSYNTIFYMTMVLPEGRRPRKFYRVQNQNIYQSATLRRSNQNYMGRNFDWTNWLQNNHASIYADITATTSNWFTYGGICYNERTNKMMINWQRTSNNEMCALLISGQSGKLLTDPAVTTEEWFNAATPVSWTDWTMVFNDGTGTEMRYDHKIMLGDNDKAAIFHHQASSTMYMTLLDWNDGSTGAHTYNNNYHSRSTGGFGGSSGYYYAQRFQSTWDNNWQICFTGTYQEGSGLAGIVVSTKDPSRCFDYYDPFNFGGGILAIGKSSFLFHRGQNTDSGSKQAGKIHLGYTSQEGTDATTYGRSNNTNPIAINNKASLAAVSSTQCGINNMWYTTDYPTFITSTWWPKDDPVFGSPTWLDF